MELATGRRAAAAASGAVLAVEALGSLLMWAGVPLAWLWIGGRVYAATSSLAADALVAFLGFVATICLLMYALRRLDLVWIELRQRAGYEQEEGALTQVVVISATLALITFTAWYYLFSHAYVLPFMPSSA
jgi:hypothetical protein